MTHIRIQVKNKQKGATQESVKQKSAKEPSKSPSKCQTWAEHRCGNGLGSQRNRPHEGGCGTAPPGATWAQFPLAVACCHATSVFSGFLIYLHQTDHTSLSKKRRSSFSRHTSFGATPDYHILYFYFLSRIWS